MTGLLSQFCAEPASLLYAVDPSDPGFRPRAMLALSFVNEATYDDRATPVLCLLSSCGYLYGMNQSVMKAKKNLKIWSLVEAELGLELQRLATL
jgi:hypothetical protein